MLTLAVGNAPSSGSTFFADLLDSAPGVLCGPELNLFAVRSHYDDFERLQRRGFSPAPTASCRVAAVRLRRGRLYSYGTDVDTVLADARDSSGFAELVERFFARYAVLRGRDILLGVEKSPANIHCAGDYLDAFPSGHFLQIVRHPGYVVRSLAARGVSPYAARATWVVDVAAGYRFRDHPRFHTVRYEDLTADPYGVVARLLSLMGLAVDEQELAYRYSTNQYRLTYSTKLIKSWQIRDTGSAGDANTDPLGRPDAEMLAWMQRQSVAGSYASRYNLPPVSCLELLAEYSYQTAVRRTTEAEGEPGPDSVTAGTAAWRPILASWAFETVVPPAGGRRLHLPTLPLSQRA